MAAATKNIATGDSFVDSVLNTSKWSTSEVTFGFTSSTADYADNYGYGETEKGYRGLTGRQINAAEEAMAKWAELIDLDITQTSGADADIRIASSSVPSTAWAYGPGNSDTAGDIWLGTAKGYYSSPQAGNYAFSTLLHEMGHALGLSHPHDDKLSGNSTSGTELGLCPCCAGVTHGMVENANVGQIDAASVSSADTTDYYGADVFDSNLDAMAFSVMSYSSYVDDGRTGYTNGTWDYVQSPMLRDIAAVQHMYGANFETRSDDTVYSWTPTDGKVFETIWDGGGRDTIDLSAYSTDVTINLAPGSWTNFGTSQLANLGDGNYAPGNIALAYQFEGDDRSLLENAIGGTGDDVLTGNAANNVLIGGAGDDQIVSASGNNILVGGSSIDELTLVGLDVDEWISASVVSVAGDDDGDDTLTGGTGNDLYLPGTGVNTVSGGDGQDTLLIAVSVNAIAISQQGGNLVFAYDDSTVDSTGIEYLATNDGIFKLGGVIEQETETNISLLYSAGLGRELDQGGLQFWAGRLETGDTLTGMADAIIDSDEFNTNFGNSDTMSVSDYVDVLYENVLNREADEEGSTYWTGVIEEGLSRSDVLVAFAVGSENRDSGLSLDTGFDSVSLIGVTETQWAEVWV